MKSHETHDLQRVYDIMDAGPNHRFTANGKLVGNSDGINLQNLSSGRKEGQTDLLRRSIIAYDGYVVVNYDSSQIELRTNCYVGNQTDMLAVFKTGGDPYVATASDIYGEPAETILHAAKVLKDPQAIYKRQVGKTAALGLGYGMGWAKFQTTALTNAGISLTAEEAKHITKVFRSKMTGIVGLWKQCDAALETMVNRHQWQFGGPNNDLFFVDGNRHLFGAHVPGIRLPNGMWLNYPGLTIKDKDGKPNFCFSKMGYNGKTTIESWIYGAKLTENCIAEGTEVLTDSGWKAIQNVTDTDLIHDGVEFVTHGGLLYKNVQSCVKVDGVFMTPDHEVLTDGGWKTAALHLSQRGTSQLKRLDRTTLRQLNLYPQVAFQWQKMVLGVPMRLWQHQRKVWCRCGQRGKAWWASKLRLFAWGAYIEKVENARTVARPNILGMAEYEGSMFESERESVPKLWRAWDSSLRQVVKFREFLRRYGTYIPAGIGYRPRRQQWALHPRELHLGISPTQLQQQTQIGACSSWRRTADRKTICGQVQSEGEYGVVSTGPRINHAGVGSAGEYDKPVYDILNCGPRTRFVVRGQSGPFIVHNCIQALAFAIMKWQGLQIAQYYPVKMNTHDEWVAVVPRAQAEEAAAFMEQVMCQTPPWAEGLPLGSEGGWAESYGEVDIKWSKDHPDNPNHEYRFDPTTGQSS